MHASFPKDQFFLIAGPCVVEGDALNAQVAEGVLAIGTKLGIPVIFKASFDKANRSRGAGYRGPGVAAGLQALETVKRAFQMPVLTDVHLPEQCAEAAKVVDVLQIPAFLCRQSDLLLAAGATGRPVNIKKGQWMAASDMRGAVEKVRSAQGDGDQSRVALTERGSFFGYGDLVVDMRSFAQMKETGNCPVIFDGTHSVQQPGRGAEGATGGNPRFIRPLVLAALAAGADGLFLETHPNPAQAPSDGANMLPLSQLEGLVRQAYDVWKLVRGA